MTKESYKTRKGRTLYRPVMDAAELEETLRSLEDAGWCLGCGEPATGVEPDARAYPCEGCGARLVYGMEELLVMELVKITEVAA